MKSERGQSAAEFALVLPILLLIVFGIVQFGLAWNHKLSLNAATRAAARTASTCRFAGTPAQQSAAIQGSYNAVADSSLPSHGPASVSYAGGSCATGAQVTVSATYPVTITIMGMTFLNTNLSSTSVSTVE